MTTKQFLLIAALLAVPAIESAYYMTHNVLWYFSDYRDTEVSK